MATHRTAACIAVGSELLGEDRLDSNSLTITQSLARHGVRVVEKRVIGDSEEQVAEKEATWRTSPLTRSSSTPAR